MREDLFDLKMKGYCCSQLIMEIGLQKLGKKNPDLILAISGLCNGMWRGNQTCGILSAAICLFCLVDAKEADKSYINDFTEWFEDAFGETDCTKLIGDNALFKAEKCPIMVEESVKKIEEILDWD